jgi:hypothetical protein
MKLKLLSPATVKPAILLVMAILVIFPSIWNNFWHVTPGKTFKRAGYGSEFLIPGRLLYSEDHGLFSMGGIPGEVLPSPPGIDNQNFQYQAFEESASYEYFKPHKSQMGFQALPMSLFSMVTGIRGNRLLEIFWMINSLLLSLTALLIAFWAQRHFGFLAAILVLLSSFLFLWFNALGRNLWFVVWVHYLPLLAMLYILKREESGTGLSAAKAGLLFYVVVVFKILMSSFEFATSSFIMPLVPLVFYAVYRQWGLKKYVTGTVFFGAVTGAAVITCILILSFQISAIDGTFRKGLEYVFYSFFKRTSGNPDDFAELPLIYESLKASRGEVLIAYLNIKALNFSFITDFLGFRGMNLFLRYYHVFSIFILASVAALWLRIKLRDDPDGVRLLDGLNLTVWASLLAPLSWFFIFKGHAYIHRGLDMIVWHMPFIYFGMMLTGLVVRRAVGRRVLSAYSIGHSA